jgi:hypothetical protein
MNAHRFDSVSFIFGVLFATVGGLFIASTSPWRWLVVDLRWSWVGPALLIALGVAIIVPVLRRQTPGGHPGEPPIEDTLEHALADTSEVLESASAELPPDPLAGEWEE